MRGIEFANAREGDVSLALHYFNGKCVYCERLLTRQYGFNNSLEWEHYYSIAEQQREDDELIIDGSLQNRVPSCRSCNRNKSDSNPEEWIRRRFPDKAEGIIENIQMYFAMQQEELF